MSISIIIAAYNEENHIEQCVENLILQSMKPDEIIVVDDGSTDRTWNILKLLQKKYPCVTIFRKKHFEQATARTFGFSKSIGKILVFPDADYAFDYEFLEKLVRPIRNGEVIATFTNDEYIANPENIWSQCWNINAYLSPGKRLPATHPMYANNFRAIRRAEFIKAGGFSETGYTNDITVLNKLGLKNAGRSVKGAICYHHNPNSLSKVFIAAYRKGSKGGVQISLANFLIYSALNSLRKAASGSFRNNSTAYLLFKCVFDAGIFLGMCRRLFERKSEFRWGQLT